MLLVLLVLLLHSSRRGSAPNAAAEPRRYSRIFLVRSSPNAGVLYLFALMRSHQKADAAPPGPSAWRPGKLSSARGAANEHGQGRYRSGFGIDATVPSSMLQYPILSLADCDVRGQHSIVS
jgi:hypothetical protein